MQDTRVDQLSTSIALWLLGATFGFLFALAPSLLPLSGAALVAFAVAMLALKGSARAALAGGASSTLGALFLYFTRQSIESCAQFNRQPGGRCDMGDSTPFVLVAAGFLLLGLLLSFLGLRLRAR